MLKKKAKRIHHCCFHLRRKENLNQLNRVVHGFKENEFNSVENAESVCLRAHFDISAKSKERTNGSRPKKQARPDYRPRAKPTR